MTRADTLLLALLFAPLLAHAAPADPYVEKATELMDVAEYAKAQKTINRGLARQGLPPETLLELYLLEGTCWVSLGQKARARSSYAKVLTIDPSYTLGPRVSPKVRQAFEETREAMLKAGDLESIYEPEHTPLGNLRGGQPAEVKLSFGNRERAKDITRVVLYVRRLGTSDFAAIDATAEASDGGTVYVARIPPYLVKEERETYAIEYYLEAYGPKERRLAGVGSPVLPLSFLVVPEEELGSGLEEKGAFPIVPVAVGVGVGAVVLTGVVVGAALLFAPKTGRATVIVEQAP